LKKNPQGTITKECGIKGDEVCGARKEYLAIPESGIFFGNFDRGRFKNTTFSKERAGGGGKVGTRTYGGERSFPLTGKSS